ncbi:hypothetical protein KHQ81_10660 [Mycoplasmatota bacterium]|nr:hypothetical protein KHQ81_10660 [Mycoplasmatota bacterium]
MKNEKMKSLIIDINLLIYIHDVVYLREKNHNFKDSNTYKELHEPNIFTIYKYLKQTRLTIFSFTIIILFMKRINFQSILNKYGLVSIISIIYGILYVWCKNDFKKLKYQLKAKKAVQYALASYNYEEFVLFLDRYLSEESTKSYFINSLS